jgi:hypothetical protein
MSADRAAQITTSIACIVLDHARLLGCDADIVRQVMTATRAAIVSMLHDELADERRQARDDLSEIDT